MPKGGYKIIDFKKAVGDGVKIPNTYNKIESANGKPIMVVNLNISGREYNSMWVNFAPVGTNYEGPLSIAKVGNMVSKVVVKPDDSVYLHTVETITASNEQGVSEEDGPSASM